MWMKLLKILAAIALILLLTFFLGAYLLPNRMSVERSIEIDRPQAQVFAMLNDLSRFNEWSPWYRLDPNAQYRFEGPASGVGAILFWQGNEQVNSGSIGIVSTQPPERVATEVRFEGMPEPARGEYEIQSLSDQRSHVTWSFAMDLAGPTARWLGLLMPRYIGADYERGLAQLKQHLESAPVQDFSDLDIQEQEVASIDVIAVSGSAPADDMAAVSAELGARYARLLDYASRHGLDLTGQPMTLSDDVGGDTWLFQAALPVRGPDPGAAEDGIERLRTRSGLALIVDHVGPYAALAQTMRRLDDYARLHGRIRDGAIQQRYVSDPGDTPEDELVTRIVYPIRP